jgi:hypothetical protein
MDTEKGTSIISKVDKVGNVIFPLVLAILGILNITGKVPAALTIWNILFLLKK